MYKEVINGAEAREIIHRGIVKVANAVKVTLGAKGRNVVIGKPMSSPHVTKDGVTVARSIYLKDFGENVGANLIKEVAGKTVELAGDGTTTATVLTLSMTSRAKELINDGINPVSLKKGMDFALGIAVEELQAISQPTNGFKDLLGVATVSCNNDDELGTLIATAFTEVGKDGIVNIEIGKSQETSIEYSKGFKLNQGFVDSRFSNGSRVVLEKPYVLILGTRITSLYNLVPIMEFLTKMRASLLIVTDGVEDQTLETLLQNQNAIKSCVVKPCGYGEDRPSILRDIQAIVGGKIFKESELLDGSVENVIGRIGRADKVIISGSTTEIIGGKADPKQSKEYILSIEKQLVDATNDFEHDMLKKRITNLRSNLATIKIGGYTQTEILEKKDRIEDAIHAVRSALQEGYCYGGGTAYIICASTIMNAFTNEKDKDVALGISLVAASLTSPFLQLLDNAGIKHDKFMKHVTDLTYGSGIDVRTGEMISFADAGIYDPTKVLRVALESAVSISGMFVTTEALIIDTE